MTRCIAGPSFVPRQLGTMQTSHSWSQNNQGYRHEPLSARMVHMQSVQTLRETASPSPRPQTSRREPSVIHFQPAVRSVFGSGTKPVVPHYGQDETSMNTLRQSLSQHIQSVQQEITRMPVNRLRAQQCYPDRFHQAGESFTDAGVPRSHSVTMHRQQLVPVPPPATSSPTAVQVPLNSPQAVSRTVSHDRWWSPSETWRRQPNCLEARFQGIGVGPANTTTTNPIPIAFLGTSRAVPTTAPSSVVRSYRELPDPQIRCALKFSGGGSAQLPLRLDLPTSGMYARVMNTSSKTQAVDGNSIHVAAARRIQKFWRRRKIGIVPNQKVQPPNICTSAPALHSSVDKASVTGSMTSTHTGHIAIAKTGSHFGGRVVYKHWAAARIQRAWKIYRWRRCFMEFAEYYIGWVGRLDWLQQHNLLYGTELADTEDVKWWMQQRANAPLDREVDSWGSERLMEHLSRVWYGRKKEQPPPKSQQQGERQGCANGAHEQYRVEVVLGTARGSLQEGSVAPQKEVATFQRGAQHLLPMCQAVAIATNTHNRQFSTGMSNALYSVSTAEPVRGNHQANLKTISSSMAHAIKTTSTPSPNDPASRGTHSDVGSASENGAFRVPSRVTPIHNYQKPQVNYHIPTHSPLQTHRARRATMPASGVVSFQVPSPVQSTRIQSTASPANRLNVVNNVHVQSQRLDAIKAHASAMSRQLPQSPPPSLTGRHAVATLVRR